MFHVEHVELFAKTLADGARQLDMTLTDHNIAQLTVYFEELIKWNRKVNLTAITGARDIAIKHFVDSLAVTKVLPSESPVTLLDIGTGAGFPGVPLKILDQTIELTLVEPSRKKIAFLHHLIGSLGLVKVTVLCNRVEQLVTGSTWAGRFSAIVTRALRLEPFMAQVHSLLNLDGRLILCRATPIRDLLAGFRIEREVAYDLPHGCGHRVLTVLRPVAGDRA